ncbi:MAG TPA: NAD(P)/FAD-dependent oxidoreductase, partial [Xanthomonadales bacterium]|nr:NAD(P)/FAD-dependent oxidoreductase [Xanthomonadales bacterium]
MNNYISLIQLTAPLNADGVRKLSRHACLDIHRVQWLRSCLDESGLRMLNWYQAQDAESVRLVLRQQGSPEAAVWPVDVFGDPTDEALSEPGSRVIFEWHPPVPDQFHTSGPLTLEGSRIRLFKPRCVAPVIGVMPAAEAPGLQRQLIAAGFEPSASWLCLELDPRPRQLFEPESPALLRREQPSAAEAERRAGGHAQFDAVIIGAGISGICMLQRLERMGLKTRVYESGSDIGGVWHWNRYPGARVDSEVYTYGFSFSDELLDHWHWSEMFAGQAEILDYLRYVVDRWSLRQHMQFNTRVVAATFDAEGGFWRIRTDKGEIITAQFLIAATGSLTTPQMPDYPGMSLFA